MRLSPILGRLVARSTPAIRRAKRPRNHAWLHLGSLEDRTVPTVIPQLLGTPTLTTPLTNVNVSQLGGDQREHSIAINPTNLANIIVCPNDLPGIFGGTSRDSIWRTTDGGITWTQVTIPIVAAGTASHGDPAILFDSTGRALYAHLVDNGGNHGAGTHFVGTAVSTDGGLNWTAANVTGPLGVDDDKEYIAVGPSRLNPGQQRFYIAWDDVAASDVIQASSSADGLTWTAPVQVDGGNASRIDTHLAVGTDGTVYLIFQDFGTADQSNIMFTRSVDDGATWSAPVNIHTTNINPFNSTFSGGRYTIPAQNTRGIWPSLSMDIDRSGGPSNGRLYVSFADSPGDSPAASHNDTNVFVMASSDGGVSFSAPVMVNDDGGTNSQFFSWLAVDQTSGVVGVSWQDARNAGAANTSTQVFGAISTTGAASFSPNVLLSAGTSDTSASGNHYGDYTGLTFFRNSFFPAWADNSNSTGDNPNGALSSTDSYTVHAYVTGSTGQVVTVSGDEQFINQDDIFLIQRNATNPTIVDFFVNGVLEYTAPLANINQVNVFGFGGNDALQVDSSNGLISASLGIRYDGGVGFDRLNLTQTGGTTQTSDTYNVGPNSGEGTSTIVGPSGTQTVFFQDLAPVLDLVPAATLTVNATPDSNVINYNLGSVAANGKVTVDNFEPIEFSGKTALTINAGAGNDIVNLNDSATPTSLTSITINANDGEDTVTTLAGLTTDMTFNGGDGNDFLSAAGSNGDAQLNGGTGNDTLIGGAGDDDLSGSAGEDILDGRGGSNSLDGGTGNDTILVSGTSGPDAITTTHTASNFNITGGLSAGTNSITSMQAVRVEAGDGADSITLTLLATGGLNYTVLGGNPIGAPGDVLTVNSGAAMTVTPGPENDAGSVVADTATPTNVSYDEIELLVIGGGGGGVINGTNGPDAITIIARDASTHFGADGVQDFTVSVNTGPEILFLNQPTLAVNALSGADLVNLRTPAPNNVAWDVDVAVDGGPPAAGDPSGSDRLVVETPGGMAEVAVYTPTGADAGTLNLMSLSSLISITTMEELLYGGEADNDSLSVLGTGIDDVITHTPGATNQSGAFQVDGLLPISYQNMGGTATLTAAGAGGADTFVYNGTPTNDEFAVGAAGQVNLNSRLVVNTADVETLTLEGLGSDDAFTLVPAISLSPYATINFNGGSQASAAGDQANLKATAADDIIAVSGQVVSQGGKTIASSGVENINLDSVGGTDTVNYNGVPGVTEAISLAGSTTAGTGVLSVPGVANLTFVNTEMFNVNGNPADVDTLTFVGTNAVDRLDINLAAAGTAGDPVLKLLAGTALKLTLVNYTGFNILNVNALDGNDAVNVFTAATGPSRNVFVDGGQPTGKNKGTDTLKVYYAGKRPKIVQSAATQNPDSGLVTLDYGTAFFSVQYASMEVVSILKS